MIIKKSNTNEMVHREAETEIIKEIQKTTFFNFMESEGFSFDYLETFFENRGICSKEQSKFNIALRKSKSTCKLDIVDGVVFLEEFFTKFRKIISLLDGQTKGCIKKELSNRHGLKIDKNYLYKIIQ